MTWGNAIKGTAFVAGLLVVLALMDMTGQAEGPSDSTVPADAAAMVSAVVSGEEIDNAGSGLPADFEEEVFSTEGFTETQSNADGTVIGMQRDGKSEEVFSLCAAQMEAHGWIEVESGQSACASFVNQEGAYAWAYVDCTAVGNTTSVVVILQSHAGT